MGFAHVTQSNKILLLVLVSLPVTLLAASDGHDPTLQMHGGIVRLDRAAPFQVPTRCSVYASVVIEQESISAWAARQSLPSCCYGRGGKSNAVDEPEAIRLSATRVDAIREKYCTVIRRSGKALLLHEPGHSYVLLA